MKRGAEMAVADINAKGGVNGQKIQLIIGDDQCDPKQAVAVANRAAKERVAVVIGHFCTRDRTSVVKGKSASVRVDPGGGGIHKHKAINMKGDRHHNQVQTT